MLSCLTRTLASRKSTFQDRADPCASLDAYNRRYPDEAMPRIKVACDEIAELTGTTGLDKPNKELVTAIIGQLSTSARLGRAFGAGYPAPRRQCSPRANQEQYRHPDLRAV